jgi:hypothetical protein
VFNCGKFGNLLGVDFGVTIGIDILFLHGVLNCFSVNIPLSGIVELGVEGRFLQNLRWRFKPAIDLHFNRQKVQVQPWSDNSLILITLLLTSLLMSLAQSLHSFVITSIIRLVVGFFPQRQQNIFQ